MNTYGERVKVTIFGESHGPAIGVVLDGVPAGEAIDMDAVRIQKAVYAGKMNEPVFAHTTKREPEIAIENNAELFDRLIKKFESAE